MNIYHIECALGEEEGRQTVGVCAASATEAAQIVWRRMEAEGWTLHRLGKIIVVDRNNQTWEPGSSVRY